MTRRFMSAAVTIGLVAGMMGTAAASGPNTTVEKYRWNDATEYAEMWAAPYGPGEGDVSIRTNRVTVDATPFGPGTDSSVFDHLKYIRISTASFDVPEEGSLEISVDITAATPGTDTSRAINGCAGVTGWQIGQPCDHPVSQTVLEGQQAGVVLNMVNFQTGQLFDWFVSGNRVFALIERLPSEVTGVPGVGLDLAYTQIIKEAAITPGKRVSVSIRYSRGPGVSRVEYFLDNHLFAAVDRVGIPLDQQGVEYTGYAPSLGPGEELSLDSFVIGHGLFSLLDVFPYQHPDAPAELNVSIPPDERSFGQGATGTWSNFQVTTRRG